MIFSFIEEKDLLIDLLFIFGFLGRTINETLVLLFKNMVLNTERQRLLKRLRRTALPYFLEIINPKPGLEPIVYLKDKSPQDRNLALFIIDLKSAEERETFNYTEIRARPFLRRRASKARPDLFPIRFINPCLFFRFRFVYFIVTFINSPILNYYSLEIYKDLLK